MEKVFVLFTSTGSIAGVHVGISIEDYAAEKECRVEWGSEGGTLWRLSNGSFAAGFNTSYLHTHVKP